MQSASYVTMVMHDTELQQFFVDKGIIELGTIYSIMRTVGEDADIDFDRLSVEEIIALISDYLE